MSDAAGQAPGAQEAEGPSEGPATARSSTWAPSLPPGQASAARAHTPPTDRTHRDGPPSQRARTADEVATPQERELYNRRGQSMFWRPRSDTNQQDPQVDPNMPRQQDGRTRQVSQRDGIPADDREEANQQRNARRAAEVRIAAQPRAVVAQEQGHARQANTRVPSPPRAVIARPPSSGDQRLRTQPHLARDRQAQETARQGPSRGQAAGSGGTGAQGSRRPTAAAQGVDSSGAYYRVDAAERAPGPGPDPPSVATDASDVRRARGSNIQQMYDAEETGDWDISRHYLDRGFMWVYYESSNDMWRGWYKLRMNDYQREFPQGDGHQYPERPPVRRRPPSTPPRRPDSDVPASKAKGASAKGHGKDKTGGPSFGSGHTQDQSWTGRQWWAWDAQQKGQGKGKDKK